jgi:outer membrane autotransporter protein
MRIHLLGTMAAVVLLAATSVHAQDATWLTVPPSPLGNFNTAANWTPNVVPGSTTSTGTAFFGPSTITSLTITAPTTLGGFTFNAGAPAYSFSIPFPIGRTLTFTGAGIINNSSNAPSFSLASGSLLNFMNSSTAGNAIITTAVASNLNFGGTSSAGTATIANSGVVFFSNSSSAGAATISNLTGGLLDFFGNSTAANSTIINSASVAFFNNASGGQARFINNAGGTLDISGAVVPVTFGSIEGAGTYLLGSNQLITGLNNLSTTVSGTIAGTGGSLVKVGTGTLTLSGANTYTGLTTISEGAINLTGSLLSPVSVEPGGTLGSTGTVFNTVTNAGTVAPGFDLPESVFGTLTVNNYVGAGGSLALRTFLGGDGSPSDLLTINGGTATGSTSVRITNVGGPGAETTSNGILVVNAINNATTAPGAFMLAPGELRAGAFDYRLFQGGLNGSDPNDWFLRSTFNGPGPPEAIGPSPPPSVLPPGFFPIIGPELATDGVVQPIARQMGLQTLGTLHQRIGDTLTLANTDGEGAGVARSDWARFFGQGIDNRYDAFADPRANGWMGGFQGGVDLLRSSFLPGHRDVAGVYIAFANSDINVNGLVTNAAATNYVQTRTGTLGLNGYSAGGYWTHYGPTGWYLDLVLQGTYYNGNAITQFANLPINGSGFISSLEGGYPIPLPLGPRFVLEPQAQIIWQQVSFNQANDGLGPVGLGTTSGPTGRVGLRGMWTIDGYNGQVWQPYVRANLWRDWGAEATTLFGIDPVPLIEEATRLEFAGGMTALLGRGVSLYAQAGYQFALDNAFIRNGVQGDIGLRFVW